MERDRLIEELRAAQALMRAELDATSRLLAIGALFVKEGNLEAVLTAIVDAAIAISGADFGNVQLLDPESGDLRIRAHRGFPDWWVEYWNTMLKGHGSCGTALDSRERVVVEDVEQSPIFHGRDLDVQLSVGVRSCQSTPIVGRAGAPIGMLSTHWREPGRPSDHALRLIELLCRQAADILERARAERALEEANEHLRDDDRRKDEFLAMLSHELRNPLMPIRNSIYVLGRATPGGEQARKAVAVMDRQLQHMARLIEDLLDVTRIRSGKVRLQRELLDLTELAQRTVEDHRGSFAESGVQLEMRAEPVPIWIDADRTRLSQAIGNLLQNAVKFTARGGRTVVSVEGDSARGQAVVRVSDTGRGITPEILSRLFQPFTQADTTLDRSQGGLGLGLALAKGLVEMQGGSIHAASAGPNEGATFTIELPLAVARAPESVRADGSPRGATCRVLIIEDNVDAADTLREALEFDGHQVEVAYGGPEGVAKARAFRPDVVFCDIGLPDMDGYAVAHALRAEIGAPLRLVALSGYARAEDVARARGAGFDVHLAKPPSIEAIERVLLELVGPARDPG